MSGPSILVHGPFEALSSFALINRRLVPGLAQAGWSVTAVAADPSHAQPIPSAGTPDVYLFHGHPYDLTNAPGRVNAFYLSYDYRRFVPADRLLARRLNAWFDLVIVPSRSVRSACRKSGVTIPIAVCPYGVDVSEFHPGAEAVSIPDRRSFCFLALGGATERKGTDIAIDAFAREFSARDDVTLVVKAFGYPHLRPWLDRRLTRARGRHGAPQIVCDTREVESVAGYFAAADMGVFPFRGEGFGLPILECLASGRPAIVTRAGGPLDYGRRGVTWLSAPERRRAGKDQVEPSRSELQRLMRTAFSRGPLATMARGRIATRARHWTWATAIARLHNRLTGLLASPRPRTTPTARTTYVFFERGLTSWRLTAAHVDRAMSRRLGHRSIPFDFRGPPPDGRTIVGQSAFALEAFTRAPDSRRILYRESGPLSAMAAIIDREQRLCGVPPAPIGPMALWRDRREAELADTIIVLSRASRGLFLRAGHAHAKLRIVSPGITHARRLPSRSRSTTRFLFVASDPFRKGIRVLLDAWRQVRTRHVELWCVTTRAAWTSPLVLRHLTGDSRIVVRPFTGVRAFLSVYGEVHALVLPTFEDGFPIAIADGMARGVPAIVSADSGIADIVRSGDNGVVVETGSARALAEAIDALSSSARLRRRLGDAAYETVQPLTWASFERRLLSVVDEGGRE